MELLITQLQASCIPQVDEERENFIDSTKMVEAKYILGGCLFEVSWSKETKIIGLCIIKVYGHKPLVVIRVPKRPQDTEESEYYFMSFGLTPSKHAPGTQKAGRIYI